VQYGQPRRGQVLHELWVGIALACQICGAELPAGARFCSARGHKVGAVVEVSEPAAAARIKQYIPAELLEKLESARASGGMQGERRVVTMPFCDVQGFTAAAEKLDPEEWAEIMNGAFEHLISSIYASKGTLARLMGDAVLAFFRAPVGHENDPQLAGLEILKTACSTLSSPRSRLGRALASGWTSRTTSWRINTTVRYPCAPSRAAPCSRCAYR
jgi:class 3 adenylate cyclase